MTPFAREAVFAAGIAGGLAALLLYAGPPGSDLAAHQYQQRYFEDHGLAPWNNFWYAGRYSFVTYSLLYYPLAAVSGIKALAMLSIAVAAIAFTVVVWREWGPRSRWSSRTFAVIWAGIVLSAAFPFALGVALALLALLALQRHRVAWFVVLAFATLAASPVAFLLLVLVMLALAVGRGGETRRNRRVLIAAGLCVSGLSVLELLLWRAFPDQGRFPFSTTELGAVLLFCAFGTALTWQGQPVRTLRFIFPVYAAACLVAYYVPSGLGENIARMRYIAIPVTVLVLTLRDWRPRIPALIALALAASWNVSPLAASFTKGKADPAGSAEYWQPAIDFLDRNLSPSYRVEAVDTLGHWAAYYLPRAGIPLARGWFRQDDFPQNAVLYGDPGPHAYLTWLRRLGVKYVVLTSAPADYSARAEAQLVRSGRTPLRPVFITSTVTVYEVPNAKPIVSGPARARVHVLEEGTMVLSVRRYGVYRVAVRWSPYWRSTAGCLFPSKDGMVRIALARSGYVRLSFKVSPGGALKGAIAGPSSMRCAP